MRAHHLIPCIVLLNALCSAQTTATWTQIKPTTSPSERLVHAMTYDAARQRVVLFGGSNSTGLLADTWEWDGKNWTQLKPTTSPPARDQHALACDSSRKRVVLFGGSGRGTLADTWEWDGKSWTQIKPTTSPPGRYNHAMAYDGARQRVVLFGGSGGNYLGDTWEWDGKAWTQIKPTTSPPARGHHAMAYDAARQQVVLFGGYTGSGRLADTWVYGRGGLLAKATSYGATCGATLAAATNSRPIIGTKFTLNSTGFATTANIGLMTVGASKTSYRGFPLPLRLDFLGMTGCYLHTSFDASFGFSVSNGAGSFAINVPNNPALLKAMVYMQSAAGLKTTNGVEIVVGNR